MAKATTSISPTGADWIALANSGQTFMLTVLTQSKRVVVAYAASKPSSSSLVGHVVSTDKSYGDLLPTEAAWIRAFSTDPNETVLCAVTKE